MQLLVGKVQCRRNIHPLVAKVLFCGGVRREEVGSVLLSTGETTGKRIFRENCI